MIEIPLSQFPYTHFIRLGIKGSSGKKKVLHNGAEVLKSKKLSIIVNPKITTNNYSVEARDQSIIFRQDINGSFVINITSDIKIIAYDTLPEDLLKYIEVEFRGMEVYIPLSPC